MRRALILTMLLFVFAIGGTVYVMASVFPSRNDVTFEENVIYGDKSAVDGLKVAVDTTWNNFLYWNTLFSPSEGQAETSYTFYPAKQSEQGITKRFGVWLSGKVVCGFDTRDENQTGIAGAMKEVYDSLNPGETRTATVSLRDYYDYYPLGVEINLPGYSLNTSWSSFSEELLSEADRKTHEAITNFFRIPVPEDEKVEFTITKESNGYSAGGGLSSYSSFYLDFSGAVTDDACYFTFNAFSADGENIDTSQIPGGYGIYRLPYSDGEVKTDELSTVFALEEDIEIINLTKSPSGDRLLLYTLENHRLTLTVIGIDEMKGIQRLDLGAENEYGEAICDGEDFQLIWRFTSELMVLRQDENGDYYTDMRADMPDSEEINTKLSFSGETIAYKNGKLALVYSVGKENLNQWSVWTAGSSFGVAVFDKTGLIYHGEYYSSLDTSGAYSSYPYICRMTGGEPLRTGF